MATKISFNPAEIREVEKNAFSNLRNHDYFLNIVVDGRREKISRVAGFTCRIEKNLVYSFRVDLDVPVRATDRSVRVEVFDPSLYVNVAWDGENPATLNGAGAVSANISRKKNKDQGYLGAQIVPEELTLKFRRK